jgi:hypothetical protein
MSTRSEPLSPLADDAGPRPAALLLDAIVAPRTAFREIRRDPHWLWPLLLFTLATFVHTLSATPFTLLRISEQIRALNPRLQGEALAQAAEAPRFMVGAVSILSSVLTPLIVVLVTAGLVHLMAVLLRGDLVVEGRAVFAACAHAAIPLALGTLARVPLILRARSLEVSLGLDAVFPGVFHGPGLLRLLQFLDGFRLWFIVLLAIAVAVTYRLPAWKAAAVSLATNVFWLGSFRLMTWIWGL